MTRSRPISLFAGAVAVPLSAVALAACGGGGAATAAPASAPSRSTSTTATATAPMVTRVASVGVARSGLGSILVDSGGRTLYLFEADSGGRSACSGACAMAWPPLLVTGRPTVGSGLAASKLGTIVRAGGGRQVTYNGHPLYLFVKDTRAGETSGQGVSAFGAAWFVVSAAGNQIPSRASRPGGGSSSSRPAAPAARPVPQPAPAVKSAPSASSGIPQNDGGDHDSDNNGGPSDGDGGI